MNLDPFKLSADELFFLEENLRSIHSLTIIQFKQLTHEKKLQHSVMLDVSDRITKRRRTIERKTAIFDTKKRYNLTLKYHEAFLLLRFIQELVLTDPHAQMLQRNLIEVLDVSLR